METHHTPESPQGDYIRYNILSEKKPAPDLALEMYKLFEYVPPRELNRHVRDLFMVFLCQHHGLLPKDFRKMSDQLFSLFTFLDMAEATLDKPK